jgi:hypothetical protein
MKRNRMEMAVGVDEEVGVDLPLLGRIDEVAVVAEEADQAEEIMVAVVVLAAATQHA